MAGILKGVMEGDVFVTEFGGEIGASDREGRHWWWWGLGRNRCLVRWGTVVRVFKDSYSLLTNCGEKGRGVCLPFGRLVDGEGGV